MTKIINNKISIILQSHDYLYGFANSKQSPMTDDSFLHYSAEKCIIE